MRQYVERMKQERHDLVSKITKAKKVIEDPPFDIDKHQIMLLAKQIKAMQEYEECLSERLNYEKTLGNN